MDQIWVKFFRVLKPFFSKFKNPLTLHEAPIATLMADASPPTNNSTAISSFNVKTDVYLYDWWLFRAEKDVEGKRLAVAGFTYNRQKGTQLFYSAPIVKKHDFVTLQTADGLRVSISGPINKIRSNENGIPSEVCDHFQNGFPFNWDRYQYHFGDIPFATSSFCLSNDQVNIEVCGSNKNSVTKKSKDAPKDSTKEKQSSALIAMDMGTDSTTVKDKATLASMGSNLVTGDEMECEPRGRDVQSHCLPAVNFIGLKGKENHRLPNDTVTENEVGVTDDVSSTAHGKTKIIEASMGSLEARRSSRLKNTKTGTHNRMDTEKRKIMLDSAGSDLATADKMDCESGTKYVADGSSSGHQEEINCLSDVLLEYPNCSSDTIQHGVPKDHSIILGSEMSIVNPSVVNMAKPSIISNNNLGSLSETDNFNDSGGEYLTSCPFNQITSSGKMDSTKKCLHPSEARKSSKLKQTGTHKRQGSGKTKVILGSLSSDFETGDKFECESLGKSIRATSSVGTQVEMHGSPDVSHVDTKLQTVATPPNDGLDVSLKYPNCRADTTQHEVSEECSIILGSEANNVNPSEVIMTTGLVIPNNHMKSLSKKDTLKNWDGEHLTSCTSKAVTLCGKMDSTKKCLDLSEPRKSSRLRNIKARTHDRQDTEINKAVTGSSGSDWVTEDTVDCESVGKYVVDSSCIGSQAELNCLSDVNLIVANTQAVLTSRNDGSILSMEKVVSNDHLTILDSKTSNVHPSEVNMATPLVIPNSHSESLSMKDKFKNSGAEHSKVVARCGEMDSTKRHLDISDVRKSSRLRNMKMGTQYRQYTKKNKFIVGSSCSDLVTEDKVDCGSGGVYIADSSSIVPREGMSCLSDVGHVVTKAKTVLTSQDYVPDVLVGCSNYGVDTTEHEVSMHYSIILNSEMNNVNPSEFVAMLIPNNHLESLTGKDKCKNSAAENLTRCPSKAVVSCGKMDSAKRRLDLSETRESSRLENMKMGTHNRQDTENNKVILCSSVSDLETGDEVDCKSRGKYVADSAQDKVAKDHSNISATEVNNFEPSGVNITTPLVIPNNHLKSSSKNVKFESSGGKNLTGRRSKAVTSCGEMDSTKESLDLSEARKSSTQNTMNSRTKNMQETSKSYKMFVDATNDTNRSIGKNDSRDNKWRESQTKTKRHLEFITEPSTPISRNQRKKLSFLYPEESSCKRSKSGRLVVPPLDYWRNQQVLYDKSRTIAGVLNGLPVAESHTGSKSEPPKKKTKFA